MTELVVWTLLFTIMAYFVCGIPFGYLFSEAFAHVDVRTKGSGNIGATNVARSVGKLPSVLTLICDAGKGALCIVIARYGLAALCFDGDVSALAYDTVEGTALSVVFAGCLLGHIFTPYLHFHGGKGVAVGFGASLALYWPVGLILLVVFVVFAVPSRYVSLGSVAAAISVPIICLALGFPVVSVLPIIFAAVLVLWAHRENIKRLIHGEENKFSFKKSDKESSTKKGE